MDVSHFGVHYHLTTLGNNGVLRPQQSTQDTLGKKSMFRLARVCGLTKLNSERASLCMQILQILYEIIFIIILH